MMKYKLSKIMGKDNMLVYTISPREHAVSNTVGILVKVIPQPRLQSQFPL